MLTLPLSDHPASAAPADLVITGARQVVLCDPSKADGIGVIDNACVAVSGESIVAVGTAAEIAARCSKATMIVDAGGGVVTPGLVDCHTHLIFVGDRSQEYYQRVAGLDDRGLNAAGIAWGVPASREFNAGRSASALVRASLARAQTMLRNGTTTLETKSGYGLDHASDIESLRAAQEIAKLTGLEIVGSYLGAHARPTEHVERYLDTMIADTIPAIAELRLAEFATSMSIPTCLRWRNARGCWPQPRTSGWEQNFIPTRASISAARGSPLKCARRPSTTATR